jgi:hypothetical protein
MLLFKYDRKYSKKNFTKIIVFLNHQKYHNLQSLILYSYKLRYNSIVIEKLLKTLLLKYDRKYSKKFQQKSLYKLR